MRPWPIALMLIVVGLDLARATASDLVDIRSGLSALHRIQDDVARGIEESSQFQSVILDRVTVSFEQLSDELLSNPEHQLALTELALSGGERVRILKLIRRVQEKGQPVSLVSGVEAYLNGEMDKAAAAFGLATDKSTGDFRANHFVMLAKGTAYLDIDLPRAREAFEMAALLAPGTLVEEVALRRLAAISLKQKDPELFLRSANVYLRRYWSSPFALEFLSNFAAAASFLDNSEDITRLGHLVMLIPMPKRLAFLSALTANFIINGKIEFAQIFATRLRETNAKNGVDGEWGAKSRLFDILNAMKIASPTSDLTVLHKLEGELAEPDMRKLLDVAKHVAWNIHKPLELSSKTKTAEAAKDANSSGDLDDIEKVLANADAVLNRLNASKGAMQ